jgi:hypothetical protein
LKSLARHSIQTAISGQDDGVSEPPEDLSTGRSESDLPAPTRAPGGSGGTTPIETASPAAATRPAGGVRAGARKLLFIVGGVVVLAIIIGILVLTLGGGDGTKETGTPLEVRQLIATFDCTSTNPGTPSDVKVTAGQEVVRGGRGGCAVVGPLIATVNRYTKITSAKNDAGCTVTFQSSAKYGEIVDRASVAKNGYARALVAGGYVLDLRARLYPPAKSDKLSVVFSASDQTACDKVVSALQKK